MFRIVSDSREQEPYSFSVPSIRKKLDAGDYSIEGRENEFVVERKSLADFVQTVIRGRERFHRELARLKTCRRACVVIEGSMSDITQARYPGGAHPASVLGAMMSINVDFGIPVYFCDDRRHACRFVEDYLRRCARLEARPTLEHWDCEEANHENCSLHPDRAADAAGRHPVDGDHPAERPA